MPSTLAPPLVYDTNLLQLDPGERQLIQIYHGNDQIQFEKHISLKLHSNVMDMIFQKRKMGDRDHWFNMVCFYKYHWLEYSVKKDYVFVLYATCSRNAVKKIHLLQIAGEIGI